MRPVVEKYLIYSDAQSRDESALPFWEIGIYYNRPQIIELYMNCSDVYKDALQNKFDLAVDYGADKIIPILAAGDKNINKQDAKGNTPLHNLVLRIPDTSICPELIFRPCSGLLPNKHVVIALIRAGADLQKRNNDGKRPWDLAEFEEIRDLLHPIAAENNNSYCTIS
jgi:ankyrin repeat protein